MENFTDKLIDQIMFLLVEGKTDDLQYLKHRLALILSKYDISQKNTALAITTPNKNDVFLKRFILAKATSGLRENSLKQYKAEISRVLDNIGKDADEITHSDIQVYIANLMMRGRSKSYCDTCRRYLNTFYAFLSREGMIQQNPMAKVDKIKFHKEKEAAFTDMELERMRNQCQTALERVILEVLLSTGCRASELCSIKIDDILDGKISICGKGGKYRTVYLNARAEIAVETYLKERKDTNPFLIPGCASLSENKMVSKVKGNWYRYRECVSEMEQYRKDSVNALVRKLGDRAGVNNVHAHRFRRTCATHALRRGMPIELVSMMLGHEQISTTQIYLDIRQEDLEQAHRKFVI